MPELMLLRHAKSLRGDGADHDRDLAPRGKRAARTMGRYLRKKGLLPDLVLCSTATRARRTWEIASGELRAALPVRELRSLYLATPARLLEIVRRQAPEMRRLLLVGHNPGMASLACRLAGEGEPAELAQLAEKFPTAALACIGFESGGWKEIGAGNGRLLRLVRPRDLD